MLMYMYEWLRYTDIDLLHISTVVAVMWPVIMNPLYLLTSSELLEGTSVVQW